MSVEKNFERKLAAIVAADVVGYSHLMGLDESGTLTRLKALLTTVFEPTVAHYHGRIVKLMGDGVLIEFSSIVDALSCCVHIQKIIPLHDEPLSEDRRILFRIGVNLGDIIVEGDDIYGDGVNIAARLEPLAEPGGICISQVARDALGNKLSLDYEGIGSQALKNIAEPIHAYRVHVRSDSDLLNDISVGQDVTSSEPIGSDKEKHPSDIQSDAGVGWDKPSIVVLPFANNSGNPNVAFFSDGIADDIITDLSRYDELIVIARQSAFAFHNRAESSYEFAKELGVEYVLEGSVRRAEGRARVTVKLVEVSTQSTLWAERYNREVQDILDVQEEIATVIVNTLVGQLAYRRYRRIQLGNANAISAYDHTLKAQQHIWAHSADHIAEARREAEIAIDLEPNYSRAHAVLAWALHAQGCNGWSDEPDKPFDRAIKHAKAAVAADENDPWGHCTLGFCLWWGHRDANRGLEEARQAVRLNPSNAHFRLIVGATLAYMGNGEEALEEIEIAMRLNPLYPGLYAIHQSRALFVAGKYEEALSQSERAVVAMPAHANALALLAACYAVLGRTDSAANVIPDILSASPGFTLRHIRRILPFARQSDLDLFCKLLEESGLPE